MNENEYIKQIEINGIKVEVEPVSILVTRYHFKEVHTAQINLFIP